MFIWSIGKAKCNHFDEYAKEKYELNDIALGKFVSSDPVYTNTNDLC